MKKIIFPDSFRPEKDLDKKTAELSKPRNDGIDISQYLNMPLVLVFADLDFKELYSLDEIIEHITIANFEFSYDGIEYSIFYFYEDNQSGILQEIGLWQLKGPSSPDRKNINQVIRIIRELHEGTFTTTHLTDDGYTAKLTLSKKEITQMEDLINFLKNFFIPKFQDVGKISVSIENITLKKIASIGLPASKLDKISLYDDKPYPL